MTTDNRTNKTALVTGGSRGIGRSISLRLAQGGVLVAVHFGHDAKAARETVEQIQAAGGQAFAIQAELGVPGDAHELWTAFDEGLARHGARPGLDILVNNAGVTLPKGITEASEEEYDRVFAVNVKAPFFIIQQGLCRLRDGGRIISVSSAAARIAIPHIVAYAMTKAALNTLTLTLAQQLGTRGITVNAVAPAFVKTDINPTLAQPHILAAAASASVFNRIGEPSDIADVVSFVASDQARWVTGHCLDATGGTHLGV
ncbi:SDR family oxidoreductase [Streptomyces sp. NBC_01210]|uniref:SDR family oxidoreductase n=1 Tax=Streptomyces sp. NBC_01210 TaxID=2903774 RepID=UPI002E15CC40|nr:SDR family oxidoreductase [Streptomyces sp. NBC_01210]